MPDSRVWHVVLILGSVKVTRGYVKKIESKLKFCDNLQSILSGVIYMERLMIDSNFQIRVILSL